MLKQYKVTWRSPGKTGTVVVKNADFMFLGESILVALFPPPGCPTEVIKIELVDDPPAKRSEIQRIPVEYLDRIGEVKDTPATVRDRLQIGLRVTAARDYSGVPKDTPGEVVEASNSWPETDSVAIKWSRYPGDKLIDWFSFDELDGLNLL